MKSWEWNTIIDFCECIKHEDYCPTHAKEHAKKEMKKFITISAGDAEKEEINEIEQLLEILRKTVVYVKNQTVAEILSTVEECGYADFD